MRKFFSELKRRRVYRAGLYYAAAAWLLVQIADIILENFSLPERVMQLIILCAGLGFPVVLVLAWIFDVGPDGVKRTPQESNLEDEESSVLPAAVTTTDSAEERPGIVVLPFDSFSDQAEDQILSDGVTEDLTTLLARLPGFFVISRNAAYSSKGQKKDLREIGRELGVRYLLEGSVRRIGDRVRIGDGAGSFQRPGSSCPWRCADSQWRS